AGVNWGSVYHALTEAAPPPAATTAAAGAAVAPGAPFANFGSRPNEADPTAGQTYNPMANPLLTQQTSWTDLNGTLVTQNSSPTVTASAAQQFAQVLGGTVVEIHTSWGNKAPVYGIQLPSGDIVDGTTI